MSSNTLVLPIVNTVLSTKVSLLPIHMNNDIYYYLKNNFNLLLKNINTDSENSKNYKEKLDTKIASLIEYNSSFPLEKKNR